ncbi:MAG: glyoxalase/bleomycin resistance/extradiol dioxygenase family protein [Chthoniobacterales bacterium]
MHLNPYLNFNGQCEAAFQVYARILGGTIIAMSPFAGTPMEGEVPPDWQNKILHARMAWGEMLLMGGDELPEDYEAPKGFNVTLNITDPADADRIFAALADGGTIRMPIQETFWAHRFGMLTDPFGIPWMINCEKAPA